MQNEEVIDLSACEREPIHIPGSVQPSGVLLVVDSRSDTILQAGGDVSRMLGFADPVVGLAVREILGHTLAELLDRSGMGLTRRPISLGRISAGPDAQELVALAHESREGTIIELQPAGPPETADRVLAQIHAAALRLGAVTELKDACQIAVQEIRKTILYDHIMVYQFLEDGSGTVVAEDRQSHLPTFLNHRFPATDIPAQARALYRQNPVRVIPDVGYTPSPVLPQISPVTGKPLDMSHCILRSVSPVHIRYLKNMGVGASMSVSLLVRGELWGLIVCHNSSPKPVSNQAVEICNHLAQLLSREILVRQEIESAKLARDLYGAREAALLELREAEDPAALLLAPSNDLQAAVHSHGLAVVSADRVAVIGHAPTEEQARGLARWLEERGCGQEGFSTECLSELYPDAGSFAPVASGMLSVVLPGDTPIVLMWFRAEQVEEINWAGNPHEPALPGDKTGSLNPRSSFANWMETKRNRSRSWDPLDLQSAQEFAARVIFILQRHRIENLNRDLEQANASLERMASEDGLTAIANRRAFDKRLQSEWSRAQRTGDSLALILLDVDFFKKYNDRYGHVMGDHCLKQIAAALQSGVRAADLAARIGGEEFAIFLADGTSEGAERAAEIVRARIEQLALPHIDSPLGVVTASVGFTVVRASRLDSVETLLNSADKALYRAKSGGRNQVCGPPGTGDHTSASHGAESMSKVRAAH